jgi:hypothetical protein
MIPSDRSRMSEWELYANGMHLRAPRRQSGRIRPDRLPDPAVLRKGD